jgi:hypothetical protein
VLEEGRAFVSRDEQRKERAIAGSCLHRNDTASHECTAELTACTCACTHVSTGVVSPGSTEATVHVVADLLLRRGGPGLVT